MTSSCANNDDYCSGGDQSSSSTLGSSIIAIEKVDDGTLSSMSESKCDSESSIVGASEAKTQDDLEADLKKVLCIEEERFCIDLVANIPGMP